MSASRILVALLAVLAVLPAAGALAAGRPSVAALQVALRAEGTYSGAVDGVRGPGTRRAIARFQLRKGIGADGIAGRRTRRALGRRGRPPIGSRVIRTGMRGWDVAALQFNLAKHGFPSGPVDGGFGARSAGALRRYQRWSGLGADGIAGAATLRALRRRPARSVLSFLPPLRSRIGDRYGPRGARRHAGTASPAAAGTPVGAAGRGCVSFAGWDASGYGNLVVVRHRRGMRTYYAHLSSISVRRGRCLVAGNRIGRVGSTGVSTGPHLHFEMRLRGALVNPLSGL